MTGNSFKCDCRLSWIYQLRNETPSEQIRNSLEELTCRLVSEDHDTNDSIDDTTEPPHINSRGYGEDHFGGRGFDSDGPRGQPDASTPEPTKSKHLFEIPQEQLPCPEEIQLEPDPKFPFQYNSGFGDGRDVNAGIDIKVISSVLMFNFVVILVT